MKEQSDLIEQLTNSELDLKKQTDSLKKANEQLARRLEEANLEKLNDLANVKDRVIAQLENKLLDQKSKFEQILKSAEEKLSASSQEYKQQTQ